MSEDRCHPDLDRECSARQTSEVNRAGEGVPSPDDHGGVSPECDDDLLERVVLRVVQMNLEGPAAEAQTVAGKAHTYFEAETWLVGSAAISAELTQP
jgi:hypothetical protein